MSDSFQISEAIKSNTESLNNLTTYETVHSRQTYFVYLTDNRIYSKFYSSIFVKNDKQNNIFLHMYMYTILL